MAAPVLTTERLILSGHGLADFDDCAAMWGDASVTRFIGGTPLSAEEVWLRLLRYVGHWPLLGYGYWAVREKTTGQFVGDVGFANLKRSIEPSLGDAPEIGWVLAASAHGQGFAAEAVAAALRWSDATLGAPETVCIIVPEHERSIRVAEAAGYVQRHLGLYRAQPMAIFTRARPFSSARVIPTS